MGRFLIGLAVLVLAIIGGISAALFSLNLGGPLPTDKDVAGWSISEAVATASGSARSRALWAQSAFAAGPPSHVLYFFRTMAENGHTLEGGCRYRLTGVPPDAGWWSLTVYDDKLALIASTGDRSINPDTVRLEDDGSFTVYVSAVPEPGNWLSDRSAGEVSIVFRVFEPSHELVKTPSKLMLPRVVQSGGCA